MTTPKRATGNLGEQIAAKYLKNKGYEILEVNYQNNFGRQIGEIDIIAKNKQEFVFVEVKTRDLNKYASTLPEENITYGKLKKLEKIANVWLRANHLSLENYHFDAVSVWVDQTGKNAKVKHIEYL